MVESRSSNAMLPVYIIGKPQLSAILREIQYMDDVMHQNNLTDSISAVASMHATTSNRGLNELAQSRGYRLDSSNDRQQLARDVQSLIASSPEYHISFASEPPIRKLKQLVQWLRENVHPQLLVQVGLQPLITAGCVIRTNNSVIDLSLRRSFDEALPVLLREVQTL